LATYPDYFGQRAAVIYLEWGMALGEEEKCPITLFVYLPKLYGLYEYCHFDVKKILMATRKWQPGMRS
jgi:hypothetical protein